MEQLEVTLPISFRQLYDWMCDYQTSQHKLQRPHMGEISYEEDHPYFIYYAPVGSLKVYWEQLARKLLTIRIEVRDNSEDFMGTLIYARELLKAITEDFPSAQVKSNDFSYNLKNIRALLTEGFTNEELRHLCFDVPDFRPVYYQLTQVISKTEIIQQLLEYIEQKELIEILLDQVKERNPAKYEKHQPYRDTPTNSSTSREVHKKSQRAITSKHIMIEPVPELSENSLLMYPHLNPPYNAVKMLYVGSEIAKDLDVRIIYLDNDGKEQTKVVKDFYPKEDPKMVWYHYKYDYLEPNQAVYFHLLKKKSVLNGKLTVSVSFSGAKSDIFVQVEREFELEEW